MTTSSQAAPGQVGSPGHHRLPPLRARGSLETVPVQNMAAGRVGDLEFVEPVSGNETVSSREDSSDKFLVNQLGF